MFSDLRIAAISDVHGNAFALEAVLAELRREAPDLIVNLGDQVWGHADPARAYDLQRDLDAVEVRGDNDQKLSPEFSGRWFKPDFVSWLRAQLPPGAPERLVHLPLTQLVDDGAVFACHGTPQSSEQELSGTWSRHGDVWQDRPAEQLRELLDGVTAQVVLCGHTHREGEVRLDGRLLVNVGSVGWQIDGDPRARWTVLERQGSRWTAGFRRVTYDWNAASGWVRQHAPHAGDEADFLLSGA